MNRRGFLASLISTAVLDPERLLWVPGAKVISVPAFRAGGSYIVNFRHALYMGSPLYIEDLTGIETTRVVGEREMLGIISKFPNAFVSGPWFYSSSKEARDLWGGNRAFPSLKV